MIDLKRVIHFLTALTCILATVTACSKPDNTKLTDTNSENQTVVVDSDDVSVEYIATKAGRDNMNKRKYKHVAVIGIDGMGNFCQKASTPNIDRIFENYFAKTDALSMAPTISAQNWGAMLTGSKPNVHKVTNQSIGQKRYDIKNVPSIFKRILDAYPESSIYSYCNWGVINNGLMEEGLNVNIDTASKDAELCEKIVGIVKNKPDFLFVQFDNVDGAGHANDYGSKEHLEEISRSDSYVGKIYDEYSKQGIIDDTLFVVVTDHGGINKGHGGYTDAEKYVFLGIAGKTVNKNAKTKFAQTRDISAIVLYAFGLDIPEYDMFGFSSQVPEGVFNDYNKEYITIEANPSIPEAKPTPEIDSKKGLYSFFDKDKVLLAVNMDNNVKDLTKNNRISESGTIKYYSTGVRSSCSELGCTGYFKAKKFKLNEASFTTSFWVRMNESLISNPAIFFELNQRSNAENKIRYTIGLRDTGLIFHLAAGESLHEAEATFPESISEGWVHTTLVFNKETRQLKVYYNFKKECTFNIDDKFFEDADKLELTIGNNSSGSHNNSSNNVSVLTDDFFVFDGAFDANDVKTLEEYYS